MKMRENNSKPKIHPLILAALILLAGLVLLGIPYFIKDSKDRHRFDANKQEANSIYRESIEPLGATPYERVAKTYKPQYIGNGFWESLACIDQTCPQITERWLVQIKPDEQKQILTQIAERHGYDAEEITIECTKEQPCSLNGRKKGYSMSISFGSVSDTGNLPQPENGKVWLSLGFTVSLFPDEIGI